MTIAIKRMAALAATTMLTGVGTIMVPVYAYAQDTSQQTTQNSSQSTEPETDEIVATGIRNSLAKNLDLKKKALAVVDAITAEDILKFPDRNVGDALQRVTGISVIRNEGEASRVSIRGANPDFTLSLLNGNFIASTSGEPTRSFDYALLPSTLVGQIDVYKSSEARVDEGGIGGTIIVNTRKPLDEKANSGALEVEAVYADTSEKIEPTFNGFYSWKNESETFGFLAAYTDSTRTTGTLSGAVEAGYRFVGSDPVDSNGNASGIRNIGALSPASAGGSTVDGFFVPQAVVLTTSDEERRRRGLQLTGQWAPTDSLEFTANYFNFKLGQDRTQNQLWVQESIYNDNVLSDITVGAGGNVATRIDIDTSASGTEVGFNFPGLRGEFVRSELKSETYDLAAEYEGDQWSVRAKVGHTEGSGGPTDQFRLGFYTGGEAADGSPSNASPTSSVIIDDNRLGILLAPGTNDRLLQGVGGFLDPGQFNSSFTNSDVSADFAQLDVSYDVDRWIVDTLHFGGKIRDTEFDRRTGNTFFLTDAQFAQSQQDPDFVDGLANNVFGVGGISQEVRDLFPSTPSLIRRNGVGSVPGGITVNDFPAIDIDALRNAFEQNFNLVIRDEEDFVFNIQEKNTAFYAQSDFSTGRLRGNVGLRYIDIDMDTSVSDSLTILYDLIDNPPSRVLSGRERTFRGFETITSEVSETHWLPSLNLAYDVTDNLIVRFAASDTIARPSIDDIARQRNLTFISQAFIDELAIIGLTPGQAGVLSVNGTDFDPILQGSGGNRTIESLESRNYDLTAEYYYGDGNGLGVALFRKEIDNFPAFLRITSQANIPDIGPDNNNGNIFEGDGDPFTFQGGTFEIPFFDTLQNGTNAVNQGIEFYWQHAFENGFGFTTNLTLNDNKAGTVTLDGEERGESLLAGSTPYQFNASVFYENDKFSARVSYNKIGERFIREQDFDVDDETGLRTNGFDVLANPFEQVDANVSYAITDNFGLTASVNNLLKEESVIRLGDDTDNRLLSSSYSGRRVYVGANYRF